MEATEVVGIGEVVVRALRLSERARFYVAEAEVAEIADKDEQAEHSMRLKAERLSRCVLYADHSPVYTSEQWEAFGNLAEFIRLDALVLRLSGTPADEAEKK